MNKPRLVIKKKNNNKQQEQPYDYDEIGLHSQIKDSIGRAYVTKY